MNILVALVMAVVGYFLGIFKERSNIKWRERREALKELFAILMKLNSCLVESKIPDDLSLEWKQCMNKNAAIIPLEILKNINELKFSNINIKNKEEYKNKINDFLMQLKEEIEETQISNFFTKIQKRQFRT